MVVPQTEILISKDGAELLRRVVAPGEYVIGRGEDCAFRVEGEKVSRHHARLFVSFQDWSVADLGSANGTQLGDQPVGAEAVKVWPSQIIRVGDATIELRALAPGEPDATLMPTQQTVRRHLPPELQGTRRYQIGKQVAQGGMGAILDALDVSTRRNVAMKVMLNVTDPGDVLRFIEEAQVTAQLEHPNIVPVHELSVNEQGEVFYTMKMVRGITLKKVIELLAKGAGDVARKYPLAALLTIFQKVCDAIAFAHSKGVIHRDLKPENIMLGDYGEVLVMDWGLARLVGSTERASVVRSAKADEGDAMRTQTGTLMGTPTYMSPEQARGEIEKLDARSDIYALGTILFELLHLRPVVTGAAVMQVVSKVQRGEVEWDAGKSQIPGSLLAVCRKALALSIAARYPRVEDLQADLLAFQNGFATSAENAGAWKHTALFIQRHKAVSIATAAALIIIVTGTAAFTTRVISERDRANRALTDLRNTAPALASEARKLIDEQKFDDALLKIRFATGIEPSNADYRLLLAQLLQARLELRPAAEEFRRVLTLISNDSARENLALCERLLREYPPPAELNHPAIRALQQQLEKEGRFTQAVPLATKLGESKKATEALLQAKLIAWRRIPGWNKRPEGDRWKWEPDGTLRIDFVAMQIEDLATLQGLPVSRLSLYTTPVSDLRPLAGMPLREITLVETPKLRDLSPLKGMLLEKIHLGYLLPPTDLTPLSGMKLKEFAFGHGHAKDFSVLRGMPLTRVSVMDNFTTLADLAGAPIANLDLIGCLELVDISALRKMPLKRLILHGCPQVRDFTPLLDCVQLEGVSVPPGRHEIEVLREHPSLKFIGWTEDTRKWTPVTEFWADYDAKKAK